MTNDITPALLHISEQLAWSGLASWSDNYLSSPDNQPAYNSYRKLMILELLIILEFYRQGMPSICRLFGSVIQF